MECGPPSKNEAFKKRIACKAVCAVNACTGGFSAGIKAFESGFTVEPSFNASHDIMLKRVDRYGFFGDIYASFHTLSEYSRKTLFKKIPVSVSNIKINAIVSAFFKLREYGSCHNIPWGKVCHRVGVFHKIDPFAVHKPCAFAS